MATKTTPPEFGPGGYLPPKAAKRARKIVLREQMGFGWPMAAVAAALLVAIAGGAFLYSFTRPPAYPFIEMQPLTDVPVGGAAMIEATAGPVPALVVRAGGTLRTFHAQDGSIRWCAESARLETADGAWLPDGTLVYGDVLRSLVPLRSTVHDGVIYVDFESEIAPPPPALGDEPPVCRGAG